MPILLPILLFAAAAAPCDLVIRNGHVIDGTGSPWSAADIGIRAGKIAAIGHVADGAAKRTIDARGMAVAPGQTRTRTLTGYCLGCTRCKC
jgi:dihydroorotase/N-acyl-D-amino-acid deacylase